MSINYSIIDDSSFNSAMHVLNLFAQEGSKSKIQEKEKSDLFPGHGKQSPLQSALNILNKAALEGSKEQKKILSGSLVSKQVKDLNSLLKNTSVFAEKAKNLGFDGKDIENVKGYQIAQPQTKFKRLLEVATLIPRVVRVFFTTLVALIFAGIIALPLDLCCNLNPKSSSHVNVDNNQNNRRPYNGFEIAGAVCFNSPLRGTPVLDKLFKKRKLEKRYHDMTIDSKWRHQLYTDSLQAERDGDLKVYTYGSTLDPACYDNCHLLTENPTRTVTVNAEGHQDTMISLSAMKFLKRAVREIDPSGTIPVIQLHGSGAGKYQFAIFRLASGHQRTFAIDYAESRFGNDPKTSIAQYADNDKIQALFKQVYEVTGQKKAILVGHSMGGLVSLEIARNIRNYKA